MRAFYTVKKKLSTHTILGQTPRSIIDVRSDSEQTGISPFHTLAGRFCKSMAILDGPTVVVATYATKDVLGGKWRVIEFEAVRWPLVPKTKFRKAVSIYDAYRTYLHSTLCQDRTQHLKDSISRIAQGDRTRDMM